MGKRICPLRTCENKERGKMKRGTKLHSFPQNIGQKKRWEDWVNAVNAKYAPSGKLFEAVSSSVICSTHFDTNCFSSSGEIVGDCIPSVFQEMTPAQLFRLNLIRSVSEAGEFYRKKPIPSSKANTWPVNCDNVNPALMKAQSEHCNNIFLLNVAPPNSKENVSIKRTAVLANEMGQKAITSSNFETSLKKAQSIYGNNIFLLNVSPLNYRESTNLYTPLASFNQNPDLTKVYQDKKNASSPVCSQLLSSIVEDVPLQPNCSKDCCPSIVEKQVQLNSAIKIPASSLHTQEGNPAGLSFHLNNQGSLPVAQSPKTLESTFYLRNAKENALSSNSCSGNVKRIPPHQLMDSTPSFTEDSDWISLLDFKREDSEISAYHKNSSVNCVPDIQSKVEFSSSNIQEIKSELVSGFQANQELEVQPGSTQIAPIFGSKHCQNNSEISLLESQSHSEDQILPDWDSMMETSATKVYAGSYTERDFATPRRRKRNLQALKDQINEGQRKLQIANQKIRRLQTKVESLTNSLQKMKEERCLKIPIH